MTSAYSSYSGCRQYRENIEVARKEVGDDAPVIDKIRVFYNHPAFIEANVDRLLAALETLPKERRESARVAFSAHSIPDSMAANCDYVAQLEETARLVAIAGSSSTRAEAARRTFRGLARTSSSISTRFHRST